MAYEKAFRNLIQRLEDALESGEVSADLTQIATSVITRDQLAWDPDSLTGEEQELYEVVEVLSDAVLWLGESDDGADERSDQALLNELMGALDGDVPPEGPLSGLWVRYKQCFNPVGIPLDVVSKGEHFLLRNPQWPDVAGGVGLPGQTVVITVDDVQKTFQIGIHPEVRPLQYRSFADMTFLMRAEKASGCARVQKDSRSEK